METRIGNAPFYCAAAGIFSGAVSAISYTKSSASSVPVLVLTLATKTSSVFGQRKIVINPLIITACLSGAIAGWLLLTSASMFIDHFVQDKDEGFALHIHRLHAVIFEINAVLIAGLLSPFCLYSPIHGPYGKDKGTPVLLLNGYLGNGTNCYFQAKELGKAEIGPVYTMNVGSFKSIEKYAQNVAERVNKITQNRAQKEIILVCHSKGGLVASQYAATLADSNNITVKKIITLGTPFGGTPIADAVGVGQDAKEMRKNSSYTKELKEKIKGCTKTQFYQIFAKHDIFTTDDSSKLESAHKEHMFNNLAHLGLIFSGKSTEKIIEWIRSE